MTADYETSWWANPGDPHPFAGVAVDELCGVCLSHFEDPRHEGLEPDLDTKEGRP